MEYALLFWGGDDRIVYAFDEQQGLKELKQTLTQILGSELQFRGFASASELLKIAEQERYDVVFADLEMNRPKFPDLPQAQ